MAVKFAILVMFTRPILHLVEHWWEELVQERLHWSNFTCIYTPFFSNFLALFNNQFLLKINVCVWACRVCTYSNLRFRDHIRRGDHRWQLANKLIQQSWWHLLHIWSSLLLPHQKKLLLLPSISLQRYWNQREIKTLLWFLNYIKLLNLIYKDPKKCNKLASSVILLRHM